MSLRIMTEQELTKFFSDNFDKIYKFFYYKFTSKETAEDLTSKTFINFVEAVRDPNNSIEDPKKYIYGIANNIFLVHLKSKYEFKDVNFSEMETWQAENLQNFVERFEKNGLLEQLEKYIPQLPEKQKVIMELRLNEKLTLQEICTELSKDMNYVKTTQKRAISSLKKLIIEDKSVHQK